MGRLFNVVFLDGSAPLEGNGSGHFLWISRLMIVHRYRPVNESWEISLMVKMRS
jgi:prepilin-type processing-associated H-X9-DG protein